MAESIPYDENWYKATWAHRAWLACGCAAVLISLLKSTFILAAGAAIPLPWLHLTAAACLGYFLADLASGLYHWAVDNYGSAQTPIFGSQIESFRLHHSYPTAIAKCETAGILHRPAAIVAAVITPINIFCGDPVILLFVGVYSGLGLFSLKFHAWAHTPRRKLPPVALVLQDAGILLRWSDHAEHHRPPYNCRYCTVSGIWNRVLDDSKFFPAMEAALFRVTGVTPRSWSEATS